LAARIGAEELRRRYVERERRIQEMEADPYRKGWVSPVWMLGWYLLGVPWVSEEIAERVRRRLGFDAPVRLLQVLGGNRGSKTEFAASTVNRIMVAIEKSVVWCFHQTSRRSIDEQQPIVRKYLPVEWNREVKSAGAYISYKMKNGFSDGKFVVDNLSQCIFKNYSMEMRDAIEGGDLNMIWNDELLPVDWLETMQLRVASQDGFILNTFTPVEGYSPTVRLLQDGAETMLDGVGYLTPADGGEPDLVRALGFRSPREMEWNHRFSRWSVPEKFNLLFGEDEEAWRNRPRADHLGVYEVEGRKFKAMPRVMRSTLPDAAVLLFWSSDNPFGNPLKVAHKLGIAA
jgi:hypothetical protein